MSRKRINRSRMNYRHLLKSKFSIQVRPSTISTYFHLRSGSSSSLPQRSIVEDHFACSHSALRALPSATSFFSSPHKPASPSLSLGHLSRHLFSSRDALCFPLHVLHPRSCIVKNTTKHGERERERLT